MTTIAKVAKPNALDAVRCRAIWKSGRKVAAEVLPNYDPGHGPSGAETGASFVDRHGSFGWFGSVKEDPPEYYNRHNNEEPLNHLADFSKMTISAAD